MTKPAILMIVENHFPYDSRVRKEAYALKDEYEITVVAIRQGQEKFLESVNGVSVIRVPALELSRIKFENRIVQGVWKKVSYVLEYAYFTSAAALAFLLTTLTRRYKAIHAHNPPETLFIVGLIGKLFSTKFIFDHHDLSPELYLTRFSGNKGFAYKMLVFLEKMSCRLADAVICTNESYKHIEIDRHRIAAKKIFVVRNNPIVSDCSTADVNITGKANDYKKTLLFLGSINPQDGVDNLMHGIHHLVYALGQKDFICNVVGGGDSLDSLKELARQLDIDTFVDFKGPVSDRKKVIEYLSTSDIGVEPAPENELNKHSTFIKVMEYMAAGKPVVAFDLPENRFSADGAAMLAPLGDVRIFAALLKQLLDDRDLRLRLGASGHQRVSAVLSWESASANLRLAYKSLNM